MMSMAVWPIIRHIRPSVEGFSCGNLIALAAYQQNQISLKLSFEPTLLNQRWFLFEFPNLVARLPDHNLIYINSPTHVTYYTLHYTLYITLHIIYHVYYITYYILHYITYYMLYIAYYITLHVIYHILRVIWCTILHCVMCVSFNDMSAIEMCITRKIQLHVGMFLD